MQRNKTNFKNEERQKFSIRKYTIGTVSVLAATFFIANGNISEASEMQKHNDEIYQTNAKTGTLGKSEDTNNKQALQESAVDVNQPESNDNKLPENEEVNPSNASTKTTSSVQDTPEYNGSNDNNSQEQFVNEPAENVEDLAENHNEGTEDETAEEKEDLVEDYNEGTEEETAEEKEEDLAEDHNEGTEDETAEEKEEDLAEDHNEGTEDENAEEKEDLAEDHNEGTEDETAEEKEEDLAEDHNEGTEDETAEEKEDLAEDHNEGTEDENAEEKEEDENTTKTGREDRKTDNSDKHQTDEKENTEQSEITDNKESKNKNENDQRAERIEKKNNLKSKSKFNDNVAKHKNSKGNRSQIQQSEVNKLLKSANNKNQGEHVNKNPIILVHGFLGLVGDNKPSIYPNYWGGKKYKVKEELEKAGYEVYEASVGAFSSNYDRAVELYHFIKGGKVDYGAAHAAKYGHDRYGNEYEGVMPNWQPGQKVHLIGHSMGGQTIRLLEQFLRFGNPEEINYQRKHGGTISPLFQGEKDNMISSITTLATPHRGSQASDKLANRDFAKKIMNDIGKLGGNKASHIDLGFGHWGLKQKPNESYLDYVKRVKNSPVWDTEDNAVRDLTTYGSEDLNLNTSVNPNIVYTSYVGQASHAGPLGNHRPNIGQYLLMHLTSSIIGKDSKLEWKENDGVVPVISALNPIGQAAKQVENLDQATEKGIWQILPIKKDWDHVDFVGIDNLDRKRTGEELESFYTGIIDHLMRIEEREEQENPKSQNVAV